MSGYKHAKEQFVSGSAGGSILTINTVCATAVTTYALWTIVSARFSSRTASSLKAPFYEFLVLVVPLLLALTLAAAHAFLLNAFLVLCIVACSSVLPPTPLSPPLSPMTSKRSTPTPGAHSSTHLPSFQVFNRPFVTVYRAHMMLMTVICILAVDFPIFPRSFAKAETYGTSIVSSLSLSPLPFFHDVFWPKSNSYFTYEKMDLGVGSFVFSLGLISALPILRQKQTESSVLHEILKSIQHSAGLLALGMVRVVMVKGVDYPEHVTEYGVHWNFFFTMAILPVFGAGLERLVPIIGFTLMALIVTAVHQLILSRTSLTSWVLTAARVSLVSQNKEGLVSLPGYLAIYLLGLGTGLYVLPPDPYFYHVMTTTADSHASEGVQRKLAEKKEKVWRSKPDKLASVLGSYAIIWSTLFVLVRWSGIEVSRRLANLPYVLWVAAFNTAFLFLYLCVHLWASKSPTTRSSSAPRIFEAINKNGLLVFLVANLLTGLVNVSIESMYTGTMIAMLSLIVYCALVVGAAWALKGKKLRI
ncbi:BZ3500_MvSof-1268-A1-R1_Chr5-2g07936 [Microbotryum saponariae]|uniref:GPI-anchored wall transfer protein n=1 Tax=Microbotryum saponariae TaxID=289078 RepID=A0A2X0M9C6_9BASI|nr:BZ3500_MvSof-1268-A1-R1_Chr5-2g07936 [Microbotryum saponariae]SDA05805.1 BZ3501_MvSof-1269-A2-R1_Chr5-2g07758 [Microbotryum saponariae]